MKLSEDIASVTFQGIFPWSKLAEWQERARQIEAELEKLQQLKASLLVVAQHNAEALALGLPTKIPVPSTLESMPKFHDING